MQYIRRTLCLLAAGAALAACTGHAEKTAERSVSPLLGTWTRDGDTSKKGSGSGPQFTKLTFAADGSLNADYVAGGLGAVVGSAPSVKTENDTYSTPEAAKLSIAEGTTHLAYDYRVSGLKLYLTPPAAVTPQYLPRQAKCCVQSATEYVLAGKCGNRTHQSPCEDLCGFEDRANHQIRTLPYADRFSRTNGNSRPRNIWRSAALARKSMIANRSVPANVVLPHLAYEDVAAAITWLTATFGFREHYRYGEPARGAQLYLGNAWIMLQLADEHRKTPAQLGSATQSLTIFIEDVLGHLQHAHPAGAKIIDEPHETVYGEWQYAVEDLDGHARLFSRHARDVSPGDWGATTASAPA